MKQRSGFTLIELLLAAAIMGIILSALGFLFSSTIRANQANTRVAESQQNAEAAIQLLKYEISLAGYRGTDINSKPINRPFTGSTLTVTPESTTRDRVSVQFYDDRPEGAVTNTDNPAQRTITFGINGNSELTRQDSAASPSTAEPVVEGVTGLKVINYVLASGGTSPTMPAPADLRGITLRLTFSNTVANQTTTMTKDITIALSNTQQ